MAVPVIGKKLEILITEAEIPSRINKLLEQKKLMVGQILIFFYLWLILCKLGMMIE